MIKFSEYGPKLFKKSEMENDIGIEIWNLVSGFHEQAVPIGRRQCEFMGNVATKVPNSCCSGDLKDLQGEKKNYRLS